MAQTTKLVIEKEVVELTTVKVEGTDYDAVKESAREFRDEGYLTTTINKGYKDGSEESKVFTFKAEKRVPKES